MNNILSSVRKLLGWNSGNETTSLDIMRQRLTGRIESEFEHEAQIEKLGRSSFDQEVIEVQYTISRRICIEHLQKISSSDLQLIFKASEHPDYKVSKLLLGERGMDFDKEHMHHVRRVSMYFNLFHDAGVMIGSYSGALFCMTLISGINDIAILRREPEDYLKALLTVYKEMPMELALSGTMNVRVRKMLKKDPRIVHHLISYCVQRNIELGKVTFTALHEHLSLPAAPLRDGAL